MKFSSLDAAQCIVCSPTVELEVPTGNYGWELSHSISNDMSQTEMQMLWHLHKAKWTCYSLWPLIAFATQFHFCNTCTNLRMCKTEHDPTAVVMRTVLMHLLLRATTHGSRNIVGRAHEMQSVLSVVQNCGRGSCGHHSTWATTLFEGQMSENNIPNPMWLDHHIHNLGLFHWCNTCGHALMSRTKADCWHWQLKSLHMTPPTVLTSALLT